jgi:hypothetical protein
MLRDTAATRLDNWCRSWERDRDLSGTALPTAHGRTAFEGCYGLADRASLA